MTQTPGKRANPHASPARARRRGNVFFNKLIQGSVISFDEAAKTQRTKLGYLLEKNLATHSPEGVKFTNLARWQWYARNGATRAWEQLPLSKQQKLAAEFEEIFHANKQTLLQNAPKRVKTSSQYYRHLAENYQKFAKELFTWMHGQRGINYEGAFSVYQSTLRLITIYLGVAKIIGEERRSQSLRQQPPHSL